MEGMCSYATNASAAPADFGKILFDGKEKFKKKKRKKKPLCEMQHINPADAALQQHFVRVAQQALQPTADLRRAAEAELKSYKDRVDQQQGFATLVLQVLANPQAPDDARSLLSTFFKNLAKDCWDHSNVEHAIQDAEKEVIKQNIFDVMKSSPANVRRQLTEAITLIAAVDFPKQWPGIIHTIIAPLSDPAASLELVDVALSTAHSVFLRYRKLDELTIETRDEIIAINAVFTKPLLSAMEKLAAVLTQDGRGPNAALACKALTSACEVLFDLICHDMGDEHEANLDIFMNVFLQALRFDDASLTGSGSRGPLVGLKSSVLSSVGLFVQRFDEEFEKYASGMLEVIWNIVASPQYADDDFDDLVISGIEVLCAACRGSTRTLLDDDVKLATLCDQVVLRNLALRDSDVEMFDESASEYIDRDIEGSDLHTRRRSASELIAALLAAFPQKVGPKFLADCTTLLQRYAAGDWRSIDTAIFLLSALALEGGSASAQRGAKGTLNTAVPFAYFLESSILPELSSAVTPASHSIVKADAIRFIATFRNHIDARFYPAIVQHLLNWLAAKHDVLYSYSCHCLERLLTVPDGVGGHRVSHAVFQPYAGAYLSGICTRLAAERTPNAYAMRCLMRICKLQAGCIAPFVGDVIMCMQAVLIESAKNPTNPVFNHCLFEVISSCVASAPQLAPQIEGALTDVFAYILSNDVLEFVPYVLQVLAQLLDCKPAGEPLTEFYQKLAPVLVAPQMYEHKGTIPAVVRLLNAMIKRDPAYLHNAQLTEKILGVFRTLIALKQHDHEGLSILTTVILHYPKEIMEPYMSTVYQLLFSRLSASKTPKYIRILIIFFSVLVIVYGAEVVVNKVNQIQQGLFWMLLTRVWLTDMQKVIGQLERKVCVVALAALLCDSQQLLAEEATWTQGVYSCLKMIHGEVEKDDVSSFVPKTASLEDLQATTQDSLASDGGFSNLFCPLSAAEAKPEDPCSAIADPNAHFRQRLHQLVAGANGQLYATRLQSQLAPELFALIR